MNAQALAERPRDADAGEYVHGVVQAVECLADALNEPAIRAELTGLDALSLEKAMERISVIVEEIDHGPR